MIRKQSLYSKQFDSRNNSCLIYYNVCYDLKYNINFVRTQIIYYKHKPIHSLIEKAM